MDILIEYDNYKQLLWLDPAKLKAEAEAIEFKASFEVWKDSNGLGDARFPSAKELHGAHCNNKS